MTNFTNDSIDELDRICRDSNNVFQMTRGGYVLATEAEDVTQLLDAIPGDIAVDVYERRSDIATRFPTLSDSTRNVIHIRRGGDIHGQELGQYFLQQFTAMGGKRVNAKVVEIESGTRYRLCTEARGERAIINADIVVNAAGPFVNNIAGMLDCALPVKNIFQQKIAFEDDRKTIPRDMPFSIDLDSKTLDWSDEEKQLLLQDDDMRWLAQEMPSGTHCRPEGGTNSEWLKLGWAYNASNCDPEEDLANEASIDPVFPEVVIRGAAKFLPSLATYITDPPKRMLHYGGYYTMTEENWPLIGPLDNKGAFVVGALSGFGSMAAAAAGKLCAAHVSGTELPAYATDLSLQRLNNKKLLSELAALQNKGLL